MSVLQTIDLKKYYGTEPNITRALDGVNFSGEKIENVPAASFDQALQGQSTGLQVISSSGEPSKATCRS